MYASQMEPIKFQGMEETAWNDVTTGFNAVVTGLKATYDGVTDAARESVCGTAEPQVVVREVVREVMVDPGNSVTALAYGGLGAAVGFFVSEAYQSQWVQATYSNIQERVKRSTNKCMDNAFQAMLGVARRCRGNHRNRVRFAPYGQRDHEVMKDAWYAMCAQAIDCHATEWKREFHLAYMVRDSKWELLDSQQALCYGLQFGLHVNERMDKRTLVCCLIATERLVLLGVANAWSGSASPQ